MITQVQGGRQDIGRVKHGKKYLEKLDYIIKKNLVALISEAEITRSETAMKNVCDTKKICDAQGPITFGQLRELVEKGKIKRIGVHVAEGGYKALLRLIPWFIPQLVLLGFGATWIRVFNKLFRPTLEETTSYKTWWGKTILKTFDLVEGELNADDPLSKIFFISDGLMTMINDKYKIEFAHYISEVASEKDDNEIVPEYFVENELRHFLNEKFFLDPPLKPKKTKDREETFNQDLSDLPDEPKKTNGDEEFYDTDLKENVRIINKKMITESYNYDSLIRKIVKDIVTIYKSNEDGEYYLPEDLDENEITYNLKNVEVSIELILEKSKEISKFLINAEYYPGDDVIAVKIIYNPKEKFKTLYELVGDLNELLGHEVRHNFQKNTEMFTLGKNYDDQEGLKYYTQPEELDAQYYGFKRMSKITKKPFELLVRDWFEKNKDIHQMNDLDSKIVIDKILKFKPMI